METERLDALREAIKDVRENEYSDFYRSRLNCLPEALPADFDAWRAIPFLTKEMIVETPFRERLFVPLAKSKMIRTSSGTSKRGLTLVPRNRIVDRSYYREFASRVLYMYAPHFSPDLSFAAADLPYLGGDAAELPATARLAAHFGADAIGSSPSLLSALIPHLEAAMDLTTVRFIELHGERASEVQAAFVRESFPNATVVTEYSCIEAHGLVGRSCPRAPQSAIRHIQVLDDLFYTELIDPETGNPAEGGEGEIVLTTLWRGNAFPLIRYRTGDLARRTRAACPCHGGAETYELLGRVAFDRALIPGGELKSAELERVMQRFKGIVRDDFELHIRDERGPQGPRPRFTLYVYPLADVSFAQIAETVMREMRVGPQKPIIEGIERGVYGPLECKTFERDVFAGRRITRIVREAIS